MKVTIKNDFNSLVAKEGIINYIMPTFAKLIIENNNDEKIKSIYCNNNEITNNCINIEKDADINLIINLKNGEKYEYQFNSILTPINKLDSINATRDYSKSYAKFSEQFASIKCDDILQAIHEKKLSIFAINEFINITNKKRQLTKIKKNYKNIKHICNLPKTHLKSTNEVRTIETVKRIGYESIPYLASHSEDWLAKTASGLKPARLFSKVEEINYEIYENLVAKSTVELACKVFKILSNKYDEDCEQLQSIYDAMFSTDSFGYDKSFSIALSNDLLSNSDDEMEQTISSKDNATSNRDLSKELLKLFTNLKETKLIKTIKKAKNVSSPLKETNILLMDKDYKVLPEVWNVLHDIISGKKISKERKFDDEKQYNTYLMYCLSVIYYAFNSLNFTYQKDGNFIRNDNFLSKVTYNNNLINVDVCYQNKCRIMTSNDIISPIKAGEKYEGFEFDGREITWNQQKTSDEIENFCKKILNLNINYKDGSKTRFYKNLKQVILAENLKFNENRKRITILPLFGLLNETNEYIFNDYISQNTENILRSQKSDFLVVALPVCNKQEQIKTSYGLNNKGRLSILPISLFEINSYRRLQKTILKIISDFMKDICPFCGNILIGKDGRFYCYNCDLIVTNTQCSNEKCKYQYRYLYKNTNENVLNMMRKAKKTFYVKDSMFQYRDIVNLNIDDRIKPICPNCGK